METIHARRDQQARDFLRLPVVCSSLVCCERLTRGWVLLEVPPEAKTRYCLTQSLSLGSRKSAFVLLALITVAKHPHSSPMLNSCAGYLALSFRTAHCFVCSQTPRTYKGSSTRYLFTLLCAPLALSNITKHLSLVSALRLTFFIFLLMNRNVWRLCQPPPR